MGWAIAAVLLAFLLCAKVGLQLIWDDGASKIKLRVGIFRFDLSKTEKKTGLKTKKKQEKPASIEKKTKKSTSVKPWLLALWQERGAVLALLGRVLHAPTMDRLHLELAAGGQEPELTYGKIWAGLCAVLPAIHNLFQVKKQSISVTCQPQLPRTQIRAEVAATVRIYELLALAIGGVKLLWKLYQSKKAMDKAV